EDVGCDMIRVEPGVVANGFDRAEHELRIASVEREAPQALGRIALDAHHGEAAPARHHRGRVLALRGAGEPRRLSGADVVAINIRLPIISDRRVEDGALVGHERWLIIVAGAPGDVQGRADGQSGWRAVRDGQADEVYVGGRRLTRETRGERDEGNRGDAGHTGKARHTSSIV